MPRFIALLVIEDQCISGSYAEAIDKLYKKYGDKLMDVKEIVNYEREIKFRELV